MNCNEEGEKCDYITRHQIGLVMTSLGQFKRASTIIASEMDEDIKM